MGRYGFGSLSNSKLLLQKTTLKNKIEYLNKQSKRNASDCGDSDTFLLES